MVAVDQSVVLGAGARGWDMIRAVEIATGWIYSFESLEFIPGTATHSIDNPDSAGRAAAGAEVLGSFLRPMGVLRLRFVTGSGFVDSDAIGVGGEFREVMIKVPAGVTASWANTVERSFESAIVSSDTASTVATTRQSVSAGLTFVGLVGLLPGLDCRVDGELDVSSFSGRTIDRSQVKIPIQFDGRRGRWELIYRLSSADANFSAALSGPSLGLNIGAAASEVRVYARVD